MLSADAAGQDLSLLAVSDFAPGRLEPGRLDPVQRRPGPVVRVEKGAARVRLLVRLGSLALAAFCALLMVDLEGDALRVLEGALLGFATLAWLVEALAGLRARRNRSQRLGRQKRKGRVRPLPVRPLV